MTEPLFSFTPASIEGEGAAIFKQGTMILRTVSMDGVDKHNLIADWVCKTLNNRLGTQRTDRPAPSSPSSNESVDQIKKLLVEALGRGDLTKWEESFVEDQLQRIEQWGSKTKFSEKQVDLIERIHRGEKRKN